MKTISTELAAHIAGEVTTLAMCWKLTLVNGTIMGFTSHNADLSIDGVTYLAGTGFTPSAIASNATLAVDNLDVEGMLDSSAITDTDIMAGIYDYAEIVIFQVNYADVSMGSVTLRKGWLGQVSFSRGHFTAEVRGLTQTMTKTIGNLYSPTCRAKLGDTQCGVNLAPLTKNGTITSVTSNQVFLDNTRTEVAGYFDFGFVTFTNGANAGLSMEVKEYTVGQVTLVLPMPYAVMAGDIYTIVAGCDKSFDTCITKFNNAVNFRGEPHVPGLDAILMTAGTTIL